MEKYKRQILVPSRTRPDDDDGVSTGSGSDRVSIRGTVEFARPMTRSLPLPVLTSSQIYSIGRTNVSPNLFRSSYTKCLILLMLGVAPFALTQDRRLPPDVKLSEASKLDKS